MKIDLPKTSIRVLLVDDDENVHLLIQHLLRKVPNKKFEVDWVATYEAGMKAIQPQTHDVYLVDYRLGAENGLELLRKANSMGVQAPIIILTGADDPIIDLEATKGGASDFLLKDRLDAITLERSIRYSIQHFETLRALQKSNERFRLLFERSLDAIMISEDDGRFIEVNPAACALLRRSRDELLQKCLSDLLSTDVAENSFVQLENNSFGELTFTLPEGEHRFAEFSACRFAHNLNLCILRDITDRRKLEQEIQEISEREQRRLGQDLHDGLGQMLTGINFLTKVLQQKLTTKAVEPEAKEAGNVVSLLNQALSQCREIARGLCPVVLENNDIHAALQQLAETLEKFFGVTVTLVCDPQVSIGDNAVAVHLYRIAQEATTNAIKHGKAKKVSLSLLHSKTFLTLRIKDDGVGIPLDALKKKGMGLRVMQHRARMMGAILEVERLKEAGTMITCKVEHSRTGKPPAPMLLVAETPLAKSRLKKKKLAGV
ncbi:MAG: putative signal transduction histidine kinase [Verrucomicrobiales bacterium]|nr:putative signal transduction histidine kinase [Verrucomicrobiales bacterium]